MRRTRFGLRTITGLLLVAWSPPVSPGTASAAAEADRGPDLALGRSVTVTGSHPEHPATTITDGSQLTYWEGPLGNFPQSVRVDLGATVGVDEVVLKLPASWEARTQTLAVEGSTDGTSFTALSASAAHRFDPDRANTVTLTFPARDVRHLRVRVTANTGWNAAQLSALEVYGEDGEGPSSHPPTAPIWRSGNRSRRPPRFTPSWQPTPTTGASTPTGSRPVTPPHSPSTSVPRPMSPPSW